MEITVLTESPVIFTKNKEWIDMGAQDIRLQPGAIILLPEDAILLTLPITTSNYLGDINEIKNK